jgi:hypothetical protein
MTFVRSVTVRRSPGVRVPLALAMSSGEAMQLLEPCSGRLGLGSLQVASSQTRTCEVSMRVPLPISCRAGRCPKVLMRYSLYWRQYLTLKEYRRR